MPDWSNEVNPFYLSPNWRRKRRYILARDSHTDQIAKRYGKYVDAQTVHHILPVVLYPQYAFADWNLISVSYATHNKLHNRTGDSLTEEGLKLALKTVRKRGERLTEEETAILLGDPPPKK